MTGAMAQSFNYKGDGAYNLKYTVNDDNTSVTCTGMVNKGDAGSADLVIPDSVSNGGIDYSVTSIGASAFYYCSGFTGSLTIPNSVTSIGNYAFTGCSGFTGSLTIGNSVTSIGDYAFQYCSGFTGSLTIGNSVTSIGSYAFKYCSKLSSLTMLSTTPPTVGSDAFQNAGFSTVNVPAGAKDAYDAQTLNGDADSDGKWQGKTIVELRYSFTALSDGTTLYYKITNADAKTVEVVSELDYYDDNKSYNTAPTGTLTIPETVSNGGIDYSVTSIGASAFNNCSGFTGALTIPNSVMSIGMGAFAACSALTSLTMLSATPPTVGSDAFLNTNLTEVNVPAGAKAAYDAQTLNGDADGDDKWQGFTIKELNYSFAALSDSTTLYYKITNADAKTVEVVSELDYYDDNKSYNTAPTGTLTIPETVSNGGIDYSVTSIGANAFNNCSGFTGSLTIPNSVTSIEDYAFFACTGFTGSLTIGNSVTSIEGAAFYSCYGFIGSLTIPNSVTSIGANAFVSCRKLTSLTMLRPTPPTVGRNAFSNVGFSTVNVPAGAKAAYDGEPADGSWEGFTIAESVSTSVASAQVAPFTRVQNTLYFAQPTQMAVYNVSGVMLHSGEVMEYTLPSAGVYIICTANGSVKVLSK